MALIYEHWRPDLNECFYVGASRIGKSRANSLVRDNDAYMMVIEELRSLGLTPFVKIIWDNLEDDCVGAYEKIRIAFQRAICGDRLTNVANGGDGFNINWTDKKKSEHSALMKVHFILNPELYESALIKSKQIRETDEFREKMTEIMSSEDYRKTQRENQIEVWKRDKHREKMQTIMSSDEYIRKQKESHSSYMAITNCVDAARSLWADPEYCRVQTERLKSLAASPEAREATGSRTHSLWKTLEFRMKMVTRSWWQTNVQHRYYWGA